MAPPAPSASSSNDRREHERRQQSVALLPHDDGQGAYSPFDIDFDRPREERDQQTIRPVYPSGQYDAGPYDDPHSHDQHAPPLPQQGTALYERPYASPLASSHMDSLQTARAQPARTPSPAPAGGARPSGEYDGFSNAGGAPSASRHGHSDDEHTTLNNSPNHPYDGQGNPAVSAWQSTHPTLAAHDGASIHSRSPLHTPADASPRKHVQIGSTPVPTPRAGQDPTQQFGYPPDYGTPMSSFSATTDGEGTIPRGRKGKKGDERPKNKRNSSWDVLRGDWDNYNSANASVRTLQFAEGDVPKSRLAKFYFYLLNMSIVTRWALYIIPVAGILWIPGIVGVTAAPNANVWGVKLLWWSVWLSVVWVGWWTAWAFAKIMPFFVRNTVGVIIPNAKHYIAYVVALEKYIALVGWAVASWAVYNAVIQPKRGGDVSGTTRGTLTTIGQVLFGIVICSAILVGEKFLIQLIAYKFHQTSYADRIAEQKFQVKALVALYARSHDLGRSDTLDGFGAKQKKSGINPAKLLKRAAREAREAAASATTALGNVASEIAGSSVLQPNSPQSMVTNALSSPNKTRQLARRIFYSFCPPHRDALILDDIAKFYPSLETAEQAFAVFDRDTNGDVSRDELEMACMEIHRERLSLTASMRDLDSAAGKLDNIFMSVYFLIAILIIVAMLDVKFSTLITSFGTFILGLSWLIGTTAQEILASIIFLFIKHPYDVSDRVNIDTDQFVVKEINLLSTVFRRTDGMIVQAPHAILNTKYVQNVRRSGPIAETFEFDVSYGTTFEQIEHLRAKMLAFLQAEKRDFLPSIDISIADIPQQTKMTLKADIKYKSNWQNGALKVQRRVKWIAALKIALADCKIFGPSGDPDAPAAPTLYTQVPYEPPASRPPSPSPEAREMALERNPSRLRFNGGMREAIDGEAGLFDDDEYVSRDPSTGYNTPARGDLESGRAIRAHGAPIAPDMRQRTRAAEGEAYEMQGRGGGNRI